MGRILEASLSDRRFTLYVSRHIARGTVTQLANVKGWDPAAALNLVRRLVQNANAADRYIAEPQEYNALPDLSRDDSRVLDLAIESRSTFLVSHDDDFWKTCGVERAPHPLLQITPGLMVVATTRFDKIIEEFKPISGGVDRNKDVVNSGRQQEHGTTSPATAYPKPPAGGRPEAGKDDQITTERGQDQSEQSASTREVAKEAPAGLEGARKTEHEEGEEKAPVAGRRQPSTGDAPIQSDPDTRQQHVRTEQIDVHARVRNVFTYGMENPMEVIAPQLEGLTGKERADRTREALQRLWDEQADRHRGDGHAGGRPDLHRGGSVRDRGIE
jgi:predicted nucleic acid-binding protein